MYLAEVLAEAIGEQRTVEKVGPHGLWISGGCTPQSAGCTLNLIDIAEAAIRALPAVVLDRSAPGATPEPADWFAALPACLVPPQPDTTPSHHGDALDAAMKAVAKPDALMAEMLEVAKIFLGHDERFQVSVGGNPIAVDRMLDHCRAIVAKAESSPSTVGGR
jgi:hypothetical protein